MTALLSITISRCFMVVVFTLVMFSVNLAHAQPPAKPFRLPIAAAPGPSTWLMGQMYGNTVGAYLRGSDWYEAGQRLHFGLDFSMPCGTPLVAMGDGQVIFVDDLGFGSGPHNLLIRHDAEGVVSLYGHLLQRPALTPGAWVSAGDVVGYSGDPDVTCDSRPHLHLEIRSLGFGTTYNPVDYIDANWNMLTSLNNAPSPLFMQDLDNPRQWMRLDDQPEVVFGGRALNDYAAPYPDYREGSPLTNPPLIRELESLNLEQAWQASPLTFGDCCPGAFWHPTLPNYLYTVDGQSNQRASLFLWDTTTRTLANTVGSAPPPILSADGSFQLQREGEGVRITQLVDGASWTVNTSNVWASLSAHNSRIAWTVTPPAAAATLDSPPLTQIWMSNLLGSDARVIAEAPRASVQWLDDSRLLVASREQVRTTLHVLDTASGETITLGSWNWLRGLNVAPGGGRLLFYLVYQGDIAQDGMYTLETVAGVTPTRLDWFGGWRWRDANSVFYLPYDSTQPYHSLHYYDLASGEDRLLLDATSMPFLVASGDWSVSPDGDQISLWNALDRTIWLFEPSGS